MMSTGEAAAIASNHVLARWLSMALVISLASLAQEAHAERRYEDGPLMPHDFKGRAPAQRTFQAETKTRLRYTYAYRTVSRPGRTTARLSQITLATMLEPDGSWNLRPNDKKLMSHEQGHFDITQVVRLRAERYWRGRVGVAQTAGETKSEAVAKLDALMKRDMQPFFLRMELLQKAYDKATRHGQDAAAQQQWEKVIDACLKDVKAPLPPIAPEPLRPPGR